MSRMVKKTDDLSWLDKCQKCGKQKETTRSRTIYTKAYMGPCGDSFCYASCDSQTCRPISAKVCDQCAAGLSKKGTTS